MKFNNVLLRHKDYIKLVNYTIQEVKDTYKSNNEEDINDITLSVNDKLVLETLIMITRDNTIQFSYFNKRKDTENESKLEADIRQ